MRPTRSRTITSISATVGAGFAVFAMIGAPTAVGDPGTTDCQAGQVVIDGQCNVPDMNANVPAPDVPAPQNGGGPGMGGGDMGDGHAR